MVTHYLGPYFQGGEIPSRWRRPEVRLVVAAYVLAPVLLVVAVVLAVNVHSQAMLCHRETRVPTVVSVWVAVAAMLDMILGVSATFVAKSQRLLGGGAVAMLLLLGLSMFAAAVVIGFYVAFLRGFCISPY